MLSILGDLISFLITGIGLLVSLFVLLTSFILQISVWILNFVLSPSFISLCYTCVNTDPGKGAVNRFVAAGWELTSGLTNIVFVVALIAIGLGTALRITGYQAKKTIPLLILVALLINFAPVLLGVIVDASNIAMNYFLSAGFGGGDVYFKQVSMAWGATGQSALAPWDIQKSTTALATSLAVNFFNLIGAAVFFLFAFLFLFRYIAIWILVILSPLAFACYVLPATRNVFNMWWKQFIQWSIIGAVASFFLYLANILMNQVLTENAVVVPDPGANPIGVLASSLLPWAIVIAFLFIGLMMSLSTSAMGSSIVVNRAKKIPGMLPKTRMGKKVLGGTASKTH